MGDYFFVVMLRQELIFVCCLSPFLLKMSIFAVVTARNHDILRLQPQECVFLYLRHRHDSKNSKSNIEVAFGGG